MIKYLKYFPSRKEHHVVNTQKGATHFCVNGGSIQPIAELQTTNRQAGFNPTTTTPLDLPTMNFGDEKQQLGNDVLDLPSTL